MGPPAAGELSITVAFWRFALVMEACPGNIISVTAGIFHGLAHRRACQVQWETCCFHHRHPR